MDPRDSDRFSTFSRRAVVLGGAMTAVFGVLGGRLYQLTVLEGETYKARAEDNRINARLVPPPRGIIVDRFGVELASNRQNYRIVLVPEDTSGGVADALDRLQLVVPAIERQRERVLREARANKPFVPITVAENLTWEEFSRVNLLVPELPGVEPNTGETRNYPFGETLSHVLGYVAAAAKEDLDEGDPLLSLPGFRVGKIGVERALDRQLRGRAGLQQIEVNAFGRVIREVARSAGAPGEDITLTIDMEVQKAAAAALGTESGSAVVMDIETGDIIAMASTPGFDPNLFNVGISSAQWRELTENPYKPLINKVLQAQYPPGSTFKMLVALAALKHGVIDPRERIFCGGKTTLGGHDFHCWKRGGHGHVDMHEGVKVSCDVYFYEIARRLGIDRIEDMCHRFGLGETYDFEVPGEKAGLVPSRAWKQARFGESWQLGETLITGIGQGYLLTTPLQLAVMTARLANGGRMVMPRIVRAIGDTLQPRPAAEEIGFDPEHVRIVLDGMNAVTNEAGGTALGARLQGEGMTMAGKTGTAQVRRISREERARGVRRNEDMPWHLRDHALFVAYAPVETPRYAISVIVDHGGSGSKAAAPRARDIMAVCLARDPARRTEGDPFAAMPRPAATAGDRI